jgi:hypothetical protein
MLPKPLSKEDILRAMKVTLSNKAAARYLHVSYIHYKRFAQNFTDETTGRTLFEMHKNQSGKGIPKFITNRGKEPALLDVIEGRVPIESYTPEKLKRRLLQEGYLYEYCNKCDFSERRVIDYKVPLLLNFKDGNKKNWNIDNVELLCYNCYFLYVGDVFNTRQLDAIEDFVQPLQTNDVNWELDEYYKEHFKELGIMDEEKEDGEEFVSRL